MLNGKPQILTAQSPVSVIDFLRDQGLDPAATGIAMAINYSVVPRSEWDQTWIHGGDEIELITARQGG